MSTAAKISGLGQLSGTPYSNRSWKRKKGENGKRSRLRRMLSPTQQQGKQRRQRRRAGCRLLRRHASNRLGLPKPRTLSARRTRWTEQRSWQRPLSAKGPGQSSSPRCPVTRTTASTRPLPASPSKRFEKRWTRFSRASGLPSRAAASGPRPWQSRRSRRRLRPVPTTGAPSWQHRWPATTKLTALTACHSLVLLLQHRLARLRP